jgi:predicted sulfurtransferase
MDSDSILNRSVISQSPTSQLFSRCFTSISTSMHLRQTQWCRNVARFSPRSSSVGRGIWRCSTGSDLWRSKRFERTSYWSQSVICICCLTMFFRIRVTADTATSIRNAAFGFDRSPASRRCSLHGSWALTCSNVRSSQEILQRKIQTERAKKELRYQSSQAAWDRNLRYQQLIHSPGQEAPLHRAARDLYQLRIHVCPKLREELKLSGRERRGRIFLQRPTTNVTDISTSPTNTIRGLKQELHGFFRVLRKDTYLLHAGYFDSIEERTPDKPEASIALERWPIESDADVVETFQKADLWFERCQHAQLGQLGQPPTPSPQRPVIVLYVSKDPNAPPSNPPKPAYLQNMPPPGDSPTITMLSFYAFPPGGIVDPDGLAMELQRLFKPFSALGRVYVAEEGVNAQMSIPTTVLPHFRQCCESIEALGPFMESGLNVDPIPLTRSEFAVAGVPVRNQPAPPFRNLHVRVRSQVVSDGLDAPLDWQRAGYDMPPLEWHSRLKQAREAAALRPATEMSKERVIAPNDVAPVVLDCRNSYESAVGLFEGAEPLNTDNFRDTWLALSERLKDIPKDTPIMTYCTGTFLFFLRKNCCFVNFLTRMPLSYFEQAASAA